MDEEDTSLDAPEGADDEAQEPKLQSLRHQRPMSQKLLQ